MSDKLKKEWDQHHAEHRDEMARYHQIVATLRQNAQHFQESRSVTQLDSNLGVPLSAQVWGNQLLGIAISSILDRAVVSSWRERRHIERMTQMVTTLPPAREYLLTRRLPDTFGPRERMIIEPRYLLLTYLLSYLLLTTYSLLLATYFLGRSC